MPAADHQAHRFTRRTFVKAGVLPGALPLIAHLESCPVLAGATARESEAGPEIIDTNVHLFDWPFRKLKGARTEALVERLRHHRITQAWVGNFEAVLHKQLDSVNRRLSEECRSRGGGMLLPFGSVNPNWPDWEEDLRRCHEAYGMRGVRLYPAYHGYTLDQPEFARLVSLAARRGLVVQIALRMEDERILHPALDLAIVDPAPLADVLRKIQEAKVQVLNAGGAQLGKSLRALVGETSLRFDMAATEGNGGVGRVLEGTNPSYQGAVPVERLLFGSHAPYAPCQSAVMKLFESPLSPEQFVKLARENALTLLD